MTCNETIKLNKTW